MNPLHHLAQQADEDCPLEYRSVHLTNAILDALRTYYVVFSGDAYVPEDDDIRIVAVSPYDVPCYTYLAVVYHDGDRASLTHRLQKLYDDNGVAGWFEVAP